jgi:glycosyltransferase involved in cell wall biosynthesis
LTGHGTAQPGPWLSTIIPTFNGERVIAEALDSVCSQNDPDIEVLVVDDGSTDSTLKIVSSYEHRLNLRVFRREHTGNWVTNTNWGIRESSGQYLSILHQDDRWEPGRLPAVRRVLMDHPDVAMCLHPSFFIGPDGRIVGRWRCPFTGRGGVRVIPSNLFVQRLLVQNFIAIPAPVFTKVAARRVGMLDESLVYTADWDFWIKLASLGPSVYIPKPLASFRVHAQSQTAALSKNADYVEQQLLCVLQRHFDRYEEGPAARRRLFKVASFSIRLNVWLMRLYTSQDRQSLHLLKDFMRLGPRGWVSFFRSSRIVDRSLSRFRAEWQPKAH